MAAVVVPVAGRFAGQNGRRSAPLMWPHAQQRPVLHAGEPFLFTIRTVEGHRCSAADHVTSSIERIKGRSTNRRGCPRSHQFTSHSAASAAVYSRVALEHAIKRLVEEYVAISSSLRC